MGQHEFPSGGNLRYQTYSQFKTLIVVLKEVNTTMILVVMAALGGISWFHYVPTFRSQTQTHRRMP